MGVAPDAQIYAVKVLDNNGKGNQSDVVAGINWAMEQGLDIINLSITSPTGSFLLEETLQKAYDQGMLIIAASGNFLSPFMKILMSYFQHNTRRLLLLAL